MEYSSFPSAFSTLFGELQKETWCCSDLYNWEGFRYATSHLPAAMAARLNFQANDSDVFLTSSMKTGTTWLKAIIPTIMNPIGRMNDDNNDPLLKRHPNELMPSLEVQLFKENPNPDLSYMPSPRLFRTHVPYPILPESIKNSTCKIVYITRDPKDYFVSLWHFLNSLVTTQGYDPRPMDEAFDSFCRGVHVFGPFHDHDPKGQLRRLACFLGRPFEKEEEVDKVLWRCSLERLKNLKVNQHGADPWLGFEYKFYFRCGSVGDWKNNMSNEMKEKADRITAMKFEGSGLGFRH
ncbi:hypothetical protein CXB51_000387 [Gossypium anomalum]|uniref:Sulfotransferase n=1 Tax=Gossypium anomalum TaxID=47600 RepID=A0A8J6DBH4_9ROSI|nr:hypothetical protein CXB51_000387 [Gossypium anomalum]